MDDKTKTETAAALKNALESLETPEEGTPAPVNVIVEAPAPALTKAEKAMAAFKLIRAALLSTAELLDAFRIVPRFILTLYGILVYRLYIWYAAIGTTVQTKCDATMTQILLDHGQTIVEAQLLACYVVDHVGGPTTAQTAFVTTVIGLATPLFAFYASTGKKWGKGNDGGE
jgi:ABC-type xylose transport system permease subunit